MGSRSQREPFQLLTRVSFSVDGTLTGNLLGSVKFFIVLLPGVKMNRFTKAAILTFRWSSFSGMCQAHDCKGLTLRKNSKEPSSLFDEQIKSF